jgi:hypothetical protein
MTQEIASEIVCEYDFQCFCGTPVVTTDKTVTCTNCGRTFEIRRVEKRTHQRRKCALQNWNTATRIGAQDVLQLVERPMIYTMLYSLLLYDLYDLLHCERSAAGWGWRRK